MLVRIQPYVINAYHLIVVGVFNMSGNRRQKTMRMMKKMNKERLDYLLDYANRLQGFQSIDSVHLHKEINEVVDQIRYELGLKQPNENLIDEFHVDKYSELDLSISGDDRQGSVQRHHGPLRVVLMRK